MSELISNWKFLEALGRAGSILTGGRLAHVELGYLVPPAIGWATKTEDGRGVIFIDLGLSDGDFVRVFLHECAHLAKHWDSIGNAYEEIRLDIIHRVNTGDPVKIHEEYPQREIEAHELQDTWAAWALDQAEAYAAKHPEAKIEHPLIVFLKILQTYEEQT